jgi:hypothetical protein
MRRDGRIPATRVDPDVVGSRVGLLLEPGDQPPHLVPDLAQEERHLRVWTRRLVDEVGGEEDRERSDERRQPRDQPPPVHRQHLTLVARERP